VIVRQGEEAINYFSWYCTDCIAGHVHTGNVGEIGSNRSGVRLLQALLIKSQGSFHPARIANVGASVGKPASTQDATRPATPHANSESLGKSFQGFRATL